MALNLLLFFLLQSTFRAHPLLFKENSYCFIAYPISNGQTCNLWNMYMSQTDGIKFNHFKMQPLFSVKNFLSYQFKIISYMLLQFSEALILIFIAIRNAIINKELFYGIKQYRDIKFSEKFYEQITITHRQIIYSLLTECLLF